MKEYWELLKITFEQWNEDNVPRLAASLAYYTAFSLAPLLIVVIAVLGFFFGDEAARGQIVAQFSDELGTEIANFVQSMLENSNNQSQGIFSTIVSVVVLLVGATTLFTQLQNALNEIWDIEVEEGGIMLMLRKRLLSFGLIITFGFLLLVSLVLNSFITSLDNFWYGIVPGMQIVGYLINLLLSFGITALVFAIIYKYMPDADIKWRDVAVGAIVTALLFTLGRFVLGFYITNFASTSTYGAAGSFVVILLWVYYSAQIVMFGAEFTQVYARRYGTQITPDAGARFSLARQLENHDVDMEEIEEKLLSDDSNSEESSSERELIPEMDRPIEITEAQITHFHKKQPDYTLIISSFVAVAGAALGWLLGRRQS